MSQQTSNRAFDDLARALAEGSISRRRALKLFAGTAIAALIPSRALAQQKVPICHKPGTPAEKTMEVSQSAVDGHLRHGDLRGPCGTTTTSTTETPTTSTTETPTTSTTTPMCIPNSGTCASGGECCSGACFNGHCCINAVGVPCNQNSDCCSGACVGGVCSD